MSFPQTCRLLEEGPGRGWGCGPEQLAATVPMRKCLQWQPTARSGRWCLTAVVPRGGGASAAGLRQILWAGKAEKGEVTCPRMTSNGENSKSARLSFVFSWAEQDT